MDVSTQPCLTHASATVLSATQKPDHQQQGCFGEGMVRGCVWGVAKKDETKGWERTGRQIFYKGWGMLPEVRMTPDNPSFKYRRTSKQCHCECCTKQKDPPK